MDLGPISLWEACRLFALLREWVEVELHPSFVGDDLDRTMPFSRCVRQGSTESGLLWEWLMRWLVAPLEQNWRREGLGLDVGDGKPNITHAICRWY